MPGMLHKLGLEFNPFEPSAAGPPLKGTLSPPTALAQRTHDMLDAYQTGGGTKALIVTGEYGTGKTCLLRWLHTEVLPNRRIKSFYFDNPGVQFYDLANALLRTIGRKDFAKFIWELSGPFVSTPYNYDLFQSGFEAYVTAQSNRRQPDLTQPLQEAIRAAGITTDEEIAHCLARIVTDAVRKPYFEYRDFVPRQQGSLVPEAEEAPYFQAILKTISKGTNAQAVAFLIDEFEEIGLQKRLTRRASHDYLATLKRLINLSENPDLEFLIVLSMTPDSYQTTVEMNPALAERFANHRLSIEYLSRQDAAALIGSRLSAARSDSANHADAGLSPVPDDINFSPVTYSNPRRLVKTCFYAISDATDTTPVPFPDSYLQSIEKKYYPTPQSPRTDGNE